jgi:Bacterial regulatory protein, Fis family
MYPAILIIAMIENSPSNVYIPQPVSIEKTTTRGRPRKVVNVDLLKEAMNPTRRISKVLLAEKLGIHRNTLRAKLKENSINSSFTEMSDEDLDQTIKNYLKSHPSSGIRYLTGHLRTQGLRIQRRRLQQSIKRVDRLGQTLRNRMTAKKSRRQYLVSRPNALWHIDGHHKLILWGIVIHGVVDGYSRKVDT